MVSRRVGQGRPRDRSTYGNRQGRTEPCMYRHRYSCVRQSADSTAALLPTVHRRPYLGFLRKYAVKSMVMCWAGVQSTSELQLPRSGMPSRSGSASQVRTTMSIKLPANSFHEMHPSSTATQNVANRLTWHSCIPAVRYTARSAGCLSPQTDSP